ncbi:hypothetical protein EJK80_03310 [Corynebacterium phoceense]|uniref:Uncharacterized protein n=1 Tax=Corynebacterium phoceense TaxID=1686286 RepID=A0A540R8X5_9CORY|nr:hypothetical protein EJK80_03310 [Corynebacterium phoceense]
MVLLCVDTFLGACLEHSGMAAQFFAPEAALPGACAAVMHNITALSMPSLFVVSMGDACRHRCPRGSAERSRYKIPLSA